MGSRGESNNEQPVHTVWITRRRSPDGSRPAWPAFWLAEVPTTQAQFARWTSSPEYTEWFEREKSAHRLDEPHRNEFGVDRGGTPHHPAERVSWGEADAFCAWLERTALGDALCRQVGLPQGWRLHARLPTEAQWEFACRTGTSTEYFNGDGNAALSDVGWYEANSRGMTHRVGEPPGVPAGTATPHGFGLHDMHGNVWEWCADWYDAGAYRSRPDRVRDPETTEVTTSVPFRVMRGGSWVNSAGYCRSALRFGGWPSDRDSLQGFRVCLLPGPVESGRGATP
ncbi:MAG: formylglycine-generating enzyme family protein [Planctomycetes bacterium]|nr:formylglycine-generating enzyme family protein [Planctomycetota bacterium]